MEENENLNANNNSKSTNGLALAGFIVSLCSLLINFGGIVGLVGTILSAVGLSKVKTKGTGKGFAITGLVIGIISVFYGIYTIINLFLVLDSIF